MKAYKLKGKKINYIKGKRCKICKDKAFKYHTNMYLCYKHYQMIENVQLVQRIKQTGGFAIKEQTKS